MSDLMHEVPTALRLRPMVALRLPTGTVRAPKRAAILIGIAAILIILGIALVPAWWQLLILACGIPTVVICTLIEARPHGKAPPAWIYVVLRHTRRPMHLTAQRYARHERGTP